MRREGKWGKFLLVVRCLQGRRAKVDKSEGTVSGIGAKTTRKITLASWGREGRRGTKGT